MALVVLLDLTGQDQPLVCDLRVMRAVIRSRGVGQGSRSLTNSRQLSAFARGHLQKFVCAEVQIVGHVEPHGQTKWTSDPFRQQERPVDAVQRRAPMNPSLRW